MRMRGNRFQCSNGNREQDIEIDMEGGAEILVLEGSFEESGDVLKQHSWLRIPIGGRMKAKAGENGAKVWVKTGHLRYVSPPEA